MKTWPLTKDELRQIVSECFDKTELAARLGYNYFNGKVSKKITELVQLHGISMDHFDPSKKVKARRKYSVVEKICPVCEKKFETQVGSKEERTTCSYECSNKHFASLRHTLEANAKTAASLNSFHELNGSKREVYHQICEWCQIPFDSLKKDQRCCSVQCAAKLRPLNPVYIANLTSAIRKRVADGLHKGWASRSKLEPSFPEKIVLEILNELGFSLERELKVSKWFIDFADIGRKIAIEIDGRQHELPKRKLSDAKKDAHLIEQGWQVYRIKWKKLTKDSRIELKDKLVEILTRD